MTRFSNFTDEELDIMEEVLCNEGIAYLVEEVRRERSFREGRANKVKNNGNWYD